MKKIWFAFVFTVLMPALIYASEPAVTNNDMLTILKAIGCLILFLLLPGIVIGIICAGIRFIRGILNI